MQSREELEKWAIEKLNNLARFVCEKEGLPLHVMTDCHVNPHTKKEFTNQEKFGFLLMVLMSLLQKPDLRAAYKEFIFTLSNKEHTDPKDNKVIWEAGRVPKDETMERGWRYFCMFAHVLMGRDELQDAPYVQ